MLSRRNFMQLGTIAAGAAVLPASAQNEARKSAASAPAIAALQSMKDQAFPITKEERRGRIEQARKLMAQNKLDAVVMSGGTSLIYFSDIRWWLSERFFAMVLPVKGEPFFVSPAFEEERAREQITQGPFDSKADVRVWEEHENPYERLAQGLKDRGISGGRIGIEERTYFVYSDELAKISPASHFASAT